MDKYYLGNPIKIPVKETPVGAVIKKGLKNKSTFNPQVLANQHIDVFRNLVVRNQEAS